MSASFSAICAFAVYVVQPAIWDRFGAIATVAVGRTARGYRVEVVVHRAHIKAYQAFIDGNRARFAGPAPVVAVHIGERVTVETRGRCYASTSTSSTM